jgi:flavin-dependent dehydrogenase
MEMIYARELLPGYGWVIPESDHRMNLGVCVDAARIGRSSGLHEVLQRFEEQHLGSRLVGARPVGRVRGQAIACRWAVPRLSKPGVLWVGEAAGLTSPITGEGIWHALASGMAAAHALETDKDARVEAEYQWRLRTRLALPLLMATGFFRLAGSPVFPPLVSGLSRGWLGRLGTMVLERL